jgi:FkbM family methyltransferase
LVAATRAIFRRLIHAFLRSRGFDIVRLDAIRSSELRRLSVIEDRHADVVLDVGANDGPYAKSLRSVGYRGRIISFEPQSEAYARLAVSSATDPLWDCRRVAVGARDGSAELNVAGNSSSSSILEMRGQHLTSAPRSRYVGTETVDLARLDTLRDQILTPEDRIFLKLDVQGYELEVLLGATHVLRQVVAVEIELSLTPLYDGAPLFDEVIRRLEAEGFVPLWLDPVFVDPVEGRLLQVDGLFGRARAATS